jgi:hypothetical protein
MTILRGRLSYLVHYHFSACLLRCAERFLKNVYIYADSQGIVCFYRNCEFVTVSVGLISLHKTQTMTSRFVTVLVAKKGANFSAVITTEDKENDLVFSHVFTLSQIYISLHKIFIFITPTSQAYRHTRTHTHTHTHTDAVLFPATKLCKL